MLFLAREVGQGLVEYALILTFVAIVVIVILAVFGDELGNTYSLIVRCLPNPELPYCAS